MKYDSSITPLPLALFGMPLSNLTLSETTKACLEKIQSNKKEGRVSYLSFINPALVAQCFGWQPTTINDLEILSILRNAELSCLSGKFLRTIGSLLGSKISPSFNPKAFLLSLCQALGEKEKGIFILSAVEKETKNAAISLHDKFSKLRLVGIATPPIFTAGEDLFNANERDALLIEQINSSNADVLFINLESAKQELWLNRVRRHLTVPLLIAIDRTLSQEMKPALAQLPVRDKKTKQEAFYKKLKVNNTCGLLSLMKLSWMAFPLVFFHAVSRLSYSCFYSKKSIKKEIESKLFLSPNRSIAIISLPHCLDQFHYPDLVKCFEEASVHDIVIFDFRGVCHIQPEGFYLLIKAWLQRNQEDKEIYGLCPSKDIECLMKLHRTWDLFNLTLCNSPEVLLSRLQCQEPATFYDTFTQGDNFVTINLLGRLDNKINYEAYIAKLLPMMEQKNCCIDFSYCTYIDNSGFSFLLNLRRHLHSKKRIMTLESVNKKFRKQFHSLALDHFFTFTEKSRL